LEYSLGSTRFGFGAQPVLSTRTAAQPEPRVSFVAFMSGPPLAHGSGAAGTVHGPSCARTAKRARVGDDGGAYQLPSPADIVEVVCADDKVLFVNLTALRETADVPGVLKRFLGIDDGGFAPPCRDKEERLDFARRLGVTLGGLAACVGFMLDPHEQGHDLTRLVSVWNLLGGPPASFRHVRHCVEEQERAAAAREAQQEHQRQLNPMTPEQDTLRTYTWTVSCHKSAADGWSATVLVHKSARGDYYHYWRKRANSAVGASSST